MTSRRARRRIAVGITLVLAGIAWTFVTAMDEDGSRPWPTVGAWVLAGTGVAIGRRLARRSDAGAAAVAVAVLAGLLVGSLAAFQRPSGGGPPLGYGNANAALFALIGLGAALVRVRATTLTRPTRLATTAVGAAAVAACVTTGSAGTVAALVTGAALAASALGLHRPWFAVPAAGITLVVGLAGTMATSARADADTLTNDSVQIRAQLWDAAADLAGEHPLSGIGPGRFEDVNPVSTDADLRRAHSIPLQIAAEQGSIGLLLTLSALGWALWMLWSVGLQSSTAVGAAIVVTGGLVACWDWVLAEPAVLGTAAVLLGMATQQPGRRGAPHRSRG